MKKTLATTLGAGLILVVGAGAAMAGNTFTGYDTTVGRVNGNGYSGSQTKASTDDSGDINSSDVGGSYKVDARMESTGGTSLGSSWVRLGDGTSARLPNFFVSGTSVRVHFSNDTSTLVNVRVRGNWKSR